MNRWKALLEKHGISWVNDRHCWLLVKKLHGPLSTSEKRELERLERKVGA